MGAGVAQRRGRPHMRIGVLGCMAERLKTQLLEADKMVDVVCGPDAVRLPPNTRASLTTLLTCSRPRHPPSVTVSRPAAAAGPGP